MDRRSFLKTSAMGGTAAAATTLAAPAYAQGKRTLTMVTSWGRGLAGVFDVVDLESHLVQDAGHGTSVVYGIRQVDDARLIVVCYRKDQCPTVVSPRGATQRHQNGDRKDANNAAAWPRMRSRSLYISGDL